MWIQLMNIPLCPVILGFSRAYVGELWKMIVDCRCFLLGLPHDVLSLLPCPPWYYHVLKEHWWFCLLYNERWTSGLGHQSGPVWFRWWFWIKQGFVNACKFLPFLWRIWRTSLVCWLCSIWWCSIHISIWLWTPCRNVWRPWWTKQLQGGVSTYVSDACSCITH